MVHGLWQQITLQAPLHQRGSMYMASVLVFLPEFSVFFGASAEGVSYAIIFCNLLVPQIERFTRPVAFGKGGAEEMKNKIVERYSCADCDHTGFRTASWSCKRYYSRSDCKPAGEREEGRGI